MVFDHGNEVGRADARQIRIDAHNVASGVPNCGGGIARDQPIHFVFTWQNKQKKITLNFYKKQSTLHMTHLRNACKTADHLQWEMAHKSRKCANLRTKFTLWLEFRVAIDQLVK